MEKRLLGIKQNTRIRILKVKKFVKKENKNVVEENLIVNGTG